MSAYQDATSTAQSWPVAGTAVALSSRPPQATHRHQSGRNCRKGVAGFIASSPWVAAGAGATYWRLGSDSGGGSFDRLASLWFVASCMVLQPGNNACTIMCAPLASHNISALIVRCKYTCTDRPAPAPAPADSPISSSESLASCYPESSLHAINGTIIYPPYQHYVCLQVALGNGGSPGSHSKRLTDVSTCAEEAKLAAGTLRSRCCGGRSATASTTTRPSSSPRASCRCPSSSCLPASSPALSTSWCVPSVQCHPPSLRMIPGSKGETLEE